MWKKGIYSFCKNSTAQNLAIDAFPQMNIITIPARRKAFMVNHLTTVSTLEKGNIKHYGKEQVTLSSVDWGKGIPDVMLYS